MSSKRKRNDADSKRWTSQEHQLMILFETVQESEAKHQGCIKQVLDIYEQVSCLLILNKTSDSSIQLNLILFKYFE